MTRLMQEQVDESLISLMRTLAHGVIYQMDNAHFARNRAVFPPRDFELYRYDGLHLSNAGNLVFRMNLAEALVYFMNKYTQGLHRKGMELHKWNYTRNSR